MTKVADDYSFYPLGGVGSDRTGPFFAGLWCFLLGSGFLTLQCLSPLCNGF